MIASTDLKFYTDLDFDDYLKMPGISYSTIKNIIKPFNGLPSKGMSLGTSVHQYLFEPHLYNGNNIQAVKPIASQLIDVFKDLLKYAKLEQSFTCTLSYNGYELFYKGRIDILVNSQYSKTVLDLKILSQSIERSCELFGYNEQLTGYQLGVGANKSYIISYNKIKKKTEFYSVMPNENFWEWAIQKFGNPINKNN